MKCFDAPTWERRDKIAPKAKLLRLCVRDLRARLHFRRQGGVTIVTDIGPSGHGARWPNVASGVGLLSS
jgi:hypothetical protein